MDPRLLRYYNQELQHLREMGAEFAQQFPKIAGRLGIDGIEVNDPYVERLLEGLSCTPSSHASPSACSRSCIRTFWRPRPRC